MKTKAYEDVIIGGSEKLPSWSVGQIRGGLLETDKRGTPKAVAVHFAGPQGPHELRIGFGDAMYLLSMLKAIQLDLDIPFPDDPRG